MKATKEQMIELVSNNLNAVSDSDLRPIYNRVYNSLLSEIIGHYVDNSTNTVHVHNNFKYHVDTELTLEQNKAKFDKMLKDRNMTVGELKLYQKVCSLFHSYYFQKRDNTFYIVADGTQNLAYFLRFLVSGEWDQNYIPATNFLNDNNINYNTIAYSYELGNLKVKRFQNGRLDIKGLTAEQTLIMDNVFNITEKAKKFIPREY